MHRPRSPLAVIGMTVILAAACGSTASPAPSTAAGAGSGAPGSVAPSAPDASAIIADLETKAKAEGALNSYGMPTTGRTSARIWAVFTAEVRPDPHRHRHVERRGDPEVRRREEQPGRRHG